MIKNIKNSFFKPSKLTLLVKGKISKYNKVLCFINRNLPNENETVDSTVSVDNYNLTSRKKLHPTNPVQAVLVSDPGQS